MVHSNKGYIRRDYMVTPEHDKALKKKSKKENKSESELVRLALDTLLDKEKSK